MTRRPPGTRTAARLSALGAVLLLGTACAAGPVSPLPVDPPQPSSGHAIGPAESRAPTRAPPSTAPLARATRERARPPVDNPTRPVEPTTGASSPQPSPPQGTPSCRGAERYDLDVSDGAFELEKSMCFAVGGVLRVQNVGPEALSAEPADLVSRSYAGGTVDVRFVRPGTVAITIVGEDSSHTITVVIRPD